MNSSNLVATRGDMGACLNENSLWWPHYDTSAAEGAHGKNLPHQTWSQYRSHALQIAIDIGMGISYS